ncbi:MAG: glycosyltransferase 87 family protein [Pseudomonadota bacterium]|nr:glycosyltransferase 87 family protein [Pseudomonadota bacterium]
MNRAVRIALEIVVVALALWQVHDVGRAMYYRLGVNFDLEWMEGATLITGLRASQGLPFYTAPQPDYIPFIYPPLYAWILGALAHVLPLGYGLGRGVSVVCTALATLALGLAARREGARWPMAFGVGALFLGCYEEAGTFYDLVRIDALALMLTGAALAVGRVESRAGAIGSGLLLALAFTAKHNMAMLGLPILLWRWRTLGLRDALVFLAASAGPALAFTIGMQVYTKGLFLTYLLEVPSKHGMVALRALPNLTKGGRVEGAQAELWRALPYVTTVGVATAWMWARTRGGAYWAGVMGVALVMVSLMRGHQGGFINVLIPMFWLLPLLPVLAERAIARDGSGWRAWVPHVFTALVAAQLWEGRGELKRFLPTHQDAQRAAALVDQLRELPGPILMPHGPWYPVLAGKDPSFSLICLWDIDKEGGPLKRESRVIDRAIANGRWATIVTPNDELGHGLLEHYERAASIQGKTFNTRTGWGVSFRAIWHPKPEAKTGDAPGRAAGE